MHPFECPQSIRAVLGRLDMIPLLFQIQVQEFSDIRIIFYDQNGFFHNKSLLRAEISVYHSYYKTKPQGMHHKIVNNRMFIPERGPSGKPIFAPQPIDRWMIPN